jgi:hypothetical protein
VLAVSACFCHNPCSEEIVLGVITGLGLNEKQAAFVGHLISGVEPAKAAELAGYANGRSAATDLLRKPAVVAAVQYETARRIGTAAPIA